MGIFRRTVKSANAPDTKAAKCPQCGATSLKRVLATHPVHLTGEFIGRRLDIYRAEMDKCRQCGTLTPTKEGNAKIKRCTKTGIEFFRQQLAQNPQPRKRKSSGSPPPRNR
jgi:predicted nucleic-acid-binding Zn-ribbon protein